MTPITILSLIICSLIPSPAFKLIFLTQAVNSEQNHSQKVAKSPDSPLSGHSDGFSYDRWTQDDQDKTAISENNIESNPSRGLQTSAHKSQQDYVCGRAVANRKYKDLLLRDQSYQLSTTRTKYRPIEIRMPRIIGGDETAPGEFPWTVSVKLNGQPICGGSLIDKSWILTAAHCVVGYNPKNLTVRLGAYRIKDTSETQTVDSPISLFIIHKQYSMPRPFSNDIALLKMIEPVEYTDFIVPICLPTEDNISTSISNEISTDYTHTSSKNFSPDDDSSGIVISSLMSDKEISKCFKRLEQNYLNSIGLGTLAPSTETATQMAPQQEQQSSASKLLSPALAALPSLQSPSSAANKNQLFSYENIQPIFLASDFKDHSLYNTGNGESNKITFVSQHHKQAAQHFEPTFMTHQHQQTNSIGNYDHQATNSNNHNNNHNNFVYYGLPWQKRSDNQPLGVDSRGETMIKLTSLPINKELLHEIQSVGSMPSLNLDTLQQGDFVAMASDLTLPSGNADRERIVNSAANKHIVRNTLIEPNENDGSPSQYSGLSGTVVGWGWVRENDGDDQISNNNKGYPSVTLQKVKLPILRNSDCEAWFQTQAKKITLLPSQFCAGFNSGGKDACRVSCLLILFDC